MSRGEESRYAGRLARAGHFEHTMSIVGYDRARLSYQSSPLMTNSRFAASEALSPATALVSSFVPVRKHQYHRGHRCPSLHSAFFDPPIFPLTFSSIPCPYLFAIARQVDASSSSTPLLFSSSPRRVSSSPLLFQTPASNSSNLPSLLYRYSLTSQHLPQLNSRRRTFRAPGHSPLHLHCVR